MGLTSGGGEGRGEKVSSLPCSHPPLLSLLPPHMSGGIIVLFCLSLRSGRKREGRQTAGIRHSHFM